MNAELSLKKGRYVMRSKEKVKILKLATIAKSLLTILILSTAFGIAYADPMMSPLLYKKIQHYKVKSETIRVVTAYNVGDPRQTDDTPCISANGENICRGPGQRRNAMCGQLRTLRLTFTCGKNWRVFSNRPNEQTLPQPGRYCYAKE